MKKLTILLAVWSFFGCEKMESNTLSSYTPAGQGGSLARFTVTGNYLYTVDNENLKVYDISNPAQPQFKRSIAVGFEIETIFPFADKLFIGSSSVVYIFNISDGANPQKSSEAISPDVLRRCDPVVAKDTVAFATLRTNGPCGGTQSILAVYDIKDVTNPVQRAQAPVVEPYGLGYSGDVLYVCDHVAGLLVFDISEPYQPQLITSLTNLQPVDVIPYNDVLLVWTQNGMNLYDITDRRNPTLLTEVN